jgi:hypothetical protein
MLITIETDAAPATGITSSLLALLSITVGTLRWLMRGVKGRNADFTILKLV